MGDGRIDLEGTSLALPQRPGYWRDESSGLLVPVVEAYLRGDQLTDAQLAVMRAYLRLWMTGLFLGAEADRLRASIDEVVTTDALRVWLGAAVDAGCDPL